MTTDLWMLLGAVVWCLLQLGILVVVRVRTPGAVEWGMGARDRPFEAPAIVGRAERAHANTVENLPLFIALVLIAHVAGKANATTATACQVFLAARVLHGLLYLAGVAFWRTAVFFVSLGALVTIAYQITR